MDIIVEMGELPRRSSPSTRHLVSRRDRTDILFITVCCQRREPTLANEQVHEALKSAWAEADHWLVGQYVVMPDHLHFFASPHKSNDLLT